MASPPILSRAAACTAMQPLPGSRATIGTPSPALRLSQELPHMNPHSALFGLHCCAAPSPRPRSPTSP